MENGVVKEIHPDKKSVTEGELFHDQHISGLESQKSNLKCNNLEISANVAENCSTDKHPDPDTPQQVYHKRIVHSHHSYLNEKDPKANQIPQKAKTHPCRPSKLDIFDPMSDLSLSEYRGLAILLFIASAYYMVVNPLMRWYERTQFVDPTLAQAMFNDFFMIMFMWCKLYFWSLTAYFLHIGYRKEYYGRPTLTILQHISQSIPIAYAVGHCLHHNWPIIPSAFVQMAAIVYFMKMHSYTETNLGFFLRQGTSEACPHYPENVNIYNFCHYLATPSLVYEPVFERGSGFRPWYFICKFLSLIAAMTIMYLACTSYLIPTIKRSPSASLVEAILNLIFPFLMLDLLIFYILFECICNLLAEVTNFKDRDFYRDWWNSTNWDEYSRKWNRPVHKFLLRHIYMEVQEKYRLGPRTATLATFLLSASLHEMILAVCFRFVRLYLFGLMLLQLPLIAMGRLYSKNKYLANGIFWACMLLGPPLLAVAYGREWAKIHFYSQDGDQQDLSFF